MDTILIIILALILIATSAILYLNIKSNVTKEDTNKEADEIAKLNAEIVKLKDSLNTTINSSLNSMSTSFNNLSTGVTKDMTAALTKVDEKVAAFNSQVENLNESQKGINKILAGVKKYGTLAEFSLGSLIKDLMPSSQYLSNVKMKEETGENVEFAIKLQEGVLVPVDSHFPVERFKAIQDAHQEDDKKAIADARTKLAKAFKEKAKSVNEKYIVPPKTTDFAIVYAPTESLFLEIANYQDPNTKELLSQELMKKYKVTIMGPNNLSGYLQSLHMGFQTLKVQKHATEIYDHLKTISTRFTKHFDGIINLRKNSEYFINTENTINNNKNFIGYFLHGLKLKSYEFKKYKSKKETRLITVNVLGRKNNLSSLDKQSSLKSFLKQNLNELEDILDAISTIDEVTVKTISKVLTLGEILSSSIIYEILNPNSLFYKLKL